MAGWLYGHGRDRHGNITYKSIDCSECEGVFKVKTFAEQEQYKEEFKFCPFCGAPMDEELNEDEE
jgi:NAD-dependent SIR2 family protein deacetylase